MLACERQQGVLDSISRHHQDGPDGRQTPVKQASVKQASVKQGLPDRARGVPGLVVGDGSPALAGTCGKQHIGRRCLGPMLQAFGHAAWIRTEAARVAHDQAAVIRGCECRLSRSHRRRLDTALRHDPHPSEESVAARFRKKDSSRALASSSTIVSAAIRLSVRKALSASARAMRGSACSTAKLLNGALPAIFSANSSALAIPWPSSTTYWEKPSDRPSSAL